MIEFSVDENSRQQVQGFLRGLGPRVTVEIHQSLKTLLYAGVESGVQKYFAGSGPKGGPTGSLLTSRSGALVNSLMASIETGIDPVAPGADTTEILAVIGSSVKYARIQEYGGLAGRPGPFKKKAGRRPYLPARPYLTPMLTDLEAAISDVLPPAVHEALESQ